VFVKTITMVLLTKKQKIYVYNENRLIKFKPGCHLSHQEGSKEVHTQQSYSPDHKLHYNLELRLRPFAIFLYSWQSKVLYLNIKKLINGGSCQSRFWLFIVILGQECVFLNLCPICNSLMKWSVIMNET